MMRFKTAWHCLLGTFILFFMDVSGNFSNKSSLQFIILGDWGGTNVAPFTTAVQLKIAARLQTLARANQFDFVIAPGDNFYFTGVKNVNDPRFQASFESVYRGAALEPIPWYFVAGNHDWYGNATAELVYSAKSSRWKFPAFFYTKVQQFLNGQSAVFVHVDTIQLCGLSLEDNRPGAGYRPLSLKNMRNADNWFTWIDQQLTRHSNATYTFVVGHYPIYSVAEHGPNECLIQKLRPLLEKHAVSAYICGHDHNLQVRQTSNTQAALTKESVMVCCRLAFANNDSFWHKDEFCPRGRGRHVRQFASTC